MKSRNDLKQEASILADFKDVLETFEEIAATRIRRTRGSVLKTRDFIEELNMIYQEVKTSQRKQIEKLAAKKKIKDPARLLFKKHNGKTLYVYISANTGLYGEIVRKTFDTFLRQLELNRNVEALLIGKVGLSLFKNKNLKINYKYFDFPDNELDNERLKEIVLYIFQFEKIVVFYGKFENIVRQSPTMADISGNPLPQQESKEAKYLFEPSLEQILEYFERQLLLSIFEQMLRESQLSKSASRMVRLDLGSEILKERLKKTSLTDRLLQHRENNKKQQETLSSMQLWKR